MTQHKWPNKGDFFKNYLWQRCTKMIYLFLSEHIPYAIVSLGANWLEDDLSVRDFIYHPRQDVYIVSVIHNKDFK